MQVLALPVRCPMASASGWVLGATPPGSMPPVRPALSVPGALLRDRLPLTWCGACLPATGPV
ncbi:hypothetical protein [Limnohabitans sp. WS1]|uniref:hypothetical protein n=1 Tax=Limnohabitans sp. WS1 TaxID=1100726 RepID=UPI000D3456C9|nr:hypothetical protein [Limnohabitans sp. WS1]PUE06160.1 hypothetical protein B9Z48_20500 [Limnohabitans sp. WS1]